MITWKSRIAATALAAVALGACGPAPASVAPASVAPVPTGPVSQPPSLFPSPSATGAASPAVAGAWRPAAPMIRPRTGFDAVVMGDGTVLAVGDDFACQAGPASPGSERAERYDPVGDAWVEVPSLNKPRKEPATVVLPDGSALVIGGLNDVDQPFSSTKKFTTGTGTWADGPLMTLGRQQPLGVTLPDGRAFVVSETDGRFTSELMDQAAGSWRTTAALPAQTTIDDMVSLRGGTVLAVGTSTGNSDPTPDAHRYDPVAGTWTDVQGLAQSGYSLVATPDGGALAVGGSDGGELWGGTGALTSRVHRFDPATGTWIQVASMATPRWEPQVVVLADGRVLVAGGSTGDVPTGQALRSTELYDPASDRWVPGADLIEPRYGGHALALSDGSVLILGGSKDFNTEGDTPWCPTPLVTTERLAAP